MKYVVILLIMGLLVAAPARAQSYEVSVQWAENGPEKKITCVNNGPLCFLSFPFDHSPVSPMIDAAIQIVDGNAVFQFKKENAYLWTITNGQNTLLLPIPKDDPVYKEVKLYKPHPQSMNVQPLRQDPVLHISETVLKKIDLSIRPLQ